MPIDYSKWDSLVISDSSSSEEEDVHENQGNGNSPPAENPGVPDHIQEYVCKRQDNFVTS